MEDLNALHGMEIYFSLLLSFNPSQTTNFRLFQTETVSCYVHTQLFLALYMYLFLVSPVAIFRTGFSLVEYCSGSFRPFLQSDY